MAFILPTLLLLALVTSSCGGVRPSHFGEYGAVENLGPSVNTDRAELVPLVSPDGRRLYFDRKYAATSIGGVADEDDIYVSLIRPDGTWGVAQNIGVPVNSDGSDVLFWISADGQKALVYSGRIVNGAPQGLSICKRVGGEWSEPVPVFISGIEGLGNYYYATITPDESHLIIAYVVDRNRQYNLDFFICPSLDQHELGLWGVPIPITALNTPDLEGAPFMAIDNRTLYFISDRPGGIGKSDIYVTRRRGNGWIDWSAPENLGPEVNTPDFEVGVSIPASGAWLYTSRNSGGELPSYGSADLYRQTLADTFRPEPRIMISGHVMRSSTPDGVAGEVAVVSPSTGDTIARGLSRPDGSFTFAVPALKEYRIVAKASGYTFGSVTVYTSGSDTQDVAAVILPIEHKIQLTAPPVALHLEKIESDWRPIGFDSGSGRLDAAAIEQLEGMYAFLRPLLDSGKITLITLIGHTDGAGPEKSNVNLSIERASVVRRWFVEKGISERLFRIGGRGAENPAADNVTTEGRALNRRVEVMFFGPVYPSE